MTTKRFFPSIVLLFCVLHGLATSPPVKTQMDFGFEPNKGQVVTTDQTPATNVLAKLEASNMDIYITDFGISYVFKKYELPDTAASNAMASIDSMPHPSRPKPTPPKVEYERIDMMLDNASIRADQIEWGNPVSPAKYNYLTRHVQIYDLQRYEKLIVKEIYPGIDWVIYVKNEPAAEQNGNHRQFIKHEFVVHPNADYARIKMRYSHPFELTDETTVTLTGELGAITENELHIHQNQKTIGGKYIRNNNDLTFEIGDYNPDETLIIDPLIWATMLGAGISGNIHGFETDPFGNCYIFFYSNPIDFPLLHLPGAFFLTSGTHVMAKFNNDNQLVWSTALGNYDNIGAEVSSYIAMDNPLKTDEAGNVFMLLTHDIPLVQWPGAYFFSPGVNTTGYANLLKFDPQGALIWNTKLPGDVIFDMALDPFSNLTLIGRLREGETIPLTPCSSGGFLRTTPANNYLFRFDSSGSLTWSTYLWNKTVINGICQDRSSNFVGYDGLGNLYMHLTFQDACTDCPPQVFLPGAYNTAFTADSHRALLKFSPTGELLWSTDFTEFATTDLTTSMRCFLVDQDGNIIFLIMGHNSTPIFLEGAYNQSFAPSYIGQTSLLKINSAGLPVWQTHLSNGGGWASLSMDFDGNLLFTTDAFYSDDIPLVDDGTSYFQTATGSSKFCKFDTQGALTWSTHYGPMSPGIISSQRLIAGKNNCLYFSTDIVPFDSWPNYLMDYGNGAYYSETGRIVLLKHCFCDTVPPHLTDSMHVCYDGTVILNGRAPNAYTYLWSTGDSTPTIRVNATGTYWVEVRKYCNDVYRDTIYIERIDSVFFGAPRGVRYIVLM